MPPILRIVHDDHPDIEIIVTTEIALSIDCKDLCPKAERTGPIVEAAIPATWAQTSRTNRQSRG
jgi:hypothetical protein